MDLIIPGAVGLVVGLLIGLVWAAASAAKSRARALADAQAQIKAEVERERLRLADESKVAIARAESAARDAAERQRVAQEAATARERDQLRTERGELDEREARVAKREDKQAAREDQLAAREQAIDKKVEALDRRDAKMREREGQIDLFTADAEQHVAATVAIQREAEARLTTIAGLDREQARAQILARLDGELAAEQAERIAKVEKDLTARAKELGIEVVARAIQRYAAEHTAETTVAKVKIADEEMKGRIIGKDGRNIKAFEQATGVDLIVDETPGSIAISCFSGLRREIARRALEALIGDGRIHPARIEEVLTKCQQDLDREVVKLGEDAAYVCDVSGLHPHLIKLLGKLHWRTSYGQNVLKHTQEVAFLCGAMAADLGLDPKLGRRCGLLHDIGKAIDHEQEGSHPELGYEALKRYGESEIVANAALAHHEGRVVISAYTTLAAAADAISAARPGARSDNVENYLKRLGQLEEIACSFKGVQKAYAIQAGRELRVIVNGHSVPDAELSKIARDIARRVEEEVAFPGEVKVTLIREMRQTAVAR
ncbi:MAG: ribonuclease Y [Planctomycetes bacterium]|nr:ribonuclease Y [Planctomycetota bacterium]